MLCAVWCNGFKSPLNSQPAVETAVLWKIQHLKCANVLNLRANERNTNNGRRGRCGRSEIRIWISWRAKRNREINGVLCAAQHVQLCWFEMLIIMLLLLARAVRIVDLFLLLFFICLLVYLRWIMYSMGRMRSFAIDHVADAPFPFECEAFHIFCFCFSIWPTKFVDQTSSRASCGLLCRFFPFWNCCTFLSVSLTIRRNLNGGIVFTDSCFTVFVSSVNRFSVFFFYLFLKMKVPPLRASNEWMDGCVIGANSQSSHLVANCISWRLNVEAWKSIYSVMFLGGIRQCRALTHIFCNNSFPKPNNNTNTVVDDL